MPGWRGLSVRHCSSDSLTCASFFSEYLRPAVPVLIQAVHHLQQLHKACSFASEMAHDLGEMAHSSSIPNLGVTDTRVHCHTFATPHRNTTTPLHHYTTTQDHYTITPPPPHTTTPLHPLHYHHTHYIHCTNHTTTPTSSSYYNTTPVHVLH